ncbi:MAG: hypothetical protein KDA21_14180, partial [Phycisphaerales bacterium]|nr:hypothetical protein [Phycisphaerales bacterium]
MPRAIGPGGASEAYLMDNSEPMRKVLGRLEGVKRCGDGFMALCPGHDDHTPSLSIREGKDGRVLIKCHAGCTNPEILTAIGLAQRDLFPAENSSRGVTKAPRNRRAGRGETHFGEEAGRLVSQLDDAKLRQLAEDLGVTEESLHAIGCGWATREDLRRLKAGGSGWEEQYPDGAFAFPERDGHGTVVGISFRAADGRKGFTRGGKRGLTVPDDLPADGEVYVVEGASDVAAGLTVGMPVIGRPSASAGAEDLAMLLEGYDVFVVAERDGDEERSPGLEGALRVQRVMREQGAESVEVVRMPAAFKDLRTWLNSLQRHGLDLHDRDACCMA